MVCLLCSNSWINMKCLNCPYIFEKCYASRTVFFTNVVKGGMKLSLHFLKYNIITWYNTQGCSGFYTARLDFLYIKVNELLSGLFRSV